MTSKRQNKGSWKPGLMLPSRPAGGRLGSLGGIDAKADSESSKAIPLAFAYGSYTLYDGNMNDLKRRIASINVENNRYSRAQISFQNQIEIERIFQLAAYRREVINLRQEELRQSEILRKKAQRQVNAGLANETDTAAFQLNLLRIEREIQSRQADIEELSLLTALKLSLPHSLILETTGVWSEVETNWDHQALLQRFQRESVHARNTDALFRESEAERQLLESEQGPKIDLEGRAGYLRFEEGLREDQPSVSLALIAKVDLFTDEMIAARKKELIARDMTVQARLDHQMKQAEEAIHMSAARLKTLKSRLALEKRLLERTKGYYDMMLDEYRRGMKNSPDLAEANSRITDLNLSMIESRYTMQSLSTDLEEELGFRIVRVKPIQESR